MLKTSLICVVALLVSTINGESVSDPPPVVKTSLGLIEGTWDVSENGKPFASFKGIPFAKPPLGELRFKDPVPIKPWTGVWKANQFYSCLQKREILLQALYGDEDCLYLNVYVPKHLLTKSGTPVIFNIHGGAFMEGSGHDYGHPHYLMNRDIILVTPNYRLSYLGFLSTLDKNAPGNAGLKDQNLALKWAQDHISNFGGDPNSVFLSGLSAGSASVHYHLLSTKSKGLFHRAHAQSGFATNMWALQTTPVENARKLAEVVGCPNTNCNKQVVECLQSKPALQLLQSLEKLQGPMNQPLTKFAPVVEKELGNDGEFLSEHPYKLLKEGNVNDVPFIASTIKDEGLFIVKVLADAVDLLDQHWDVFAPFFLMYNHTLPPSEWASTAQKIKQHYFTNGKMSSNTLDNFITLVNDRFFLIDGQTATLLHAKAVKSPVYYYTFHYEGEHSLADVIKVGKHVKGVTHGDDNIYVFAKAFTEQPLSRESDLKMKELMLDFWVDFAYTGVPKFGNLANWEPIAQGKLNLLEIQSPENYEMKFDQTLTKNKQFWLDLGLLENEKLFETKDNKDEL